ncbi:DUF2586 family protein [Phocaeicola faecicola]|jgi:hypothetical protein|uniref:DUF2586 family protein n=1 Tax=Phocaeicola faecicola TaxID=2739389 RepID=UPI002A7FFCA2|nr:DUF2586 family protein [Phocaeicola faecicola]MDY4872620.1 DUF2586 family protein [Phocaeicola faecicola]
MPLPKITISYLNGQLGTVPTSQDGLLALACGAEAVDSTFVLGTPYKIYRTEGLTALGIKAETTDNVQLYKHVKDFYSVAPEGTPLVIVGYDKTKTMTELCDKTTGELKTLLQKQKGELRGIIVCRDPDTDSPVVTEGLDPDVFTALPKAQELVKYAADNLYAPIFVALEGRAYKDAATLKDLKDGTDNGVCIVIGDTKTGSKAAAMGLFAGKVAIASVQRNIGRVADGPIGPTVMYLADKKVEDVMDDIATIYDKRYITPRTYVGRSGYYYTDDNMCCKATDDYAQLANRRVIDKAFRIAYNTLLDLLLDEIYVQEDGTMQPAVLKSWQSTVEQAINTQMTARGELSADTAAGESGCVCIIDPKQNVLATSTINVVLKVRPFGYARQIKVELGFQVQAKS